MIFLGALFLMDFKSTHGTFVNKERIDPHDFKRLHIGDIVSFGESSRLYAICGPQELLPAEYDSLNLQKFRERVCKNCMPISYMLSF
jgi:pSer/pThr/pTyr-binding forkhead associated (FHA) protein